MGKQAPGARSDAREVARRSRQVAAAMYARAVAEGRHRREVRILCEGCGVPMDGAWRRTVDGKLICRTCAKE